MAKKWKSTGSRGVRYYEHPTRKHGIRKDRYFAIRYTVEGKQREEGLGWASEGMTSELANEKRTELIKNRRIGEGPRTLKEKKKEHEVKQALQLAEGLTLSEFWAKDYVHNLKSRIKASSWIQEVRLYTKRILPIMGNKPLKTITNVDVDKMLDDMRKEGLSPRTMEYAVGTVHRIMKHAAKRKYVQAGSNPAIGINLPKINNTRTRVFTPLELNQILEYLNNSDRAAFELTLFCMFVGCRFSDAARLKWENVNLSRRTAVFVDTKNKDVRQVYLVFEVAEMLTKRGIGKAGEYVFTSKDGKPWREPPSAFRTAIEKLSLNEGRGARDKASFHSLRHTAATFAARKGVPVKDLMEIFGWRSPSMVFRYAKGDEGVQRKAMTGLAESLTLEQGKVIELFKKG